MPVTRVAIREGKGEDYKQALLDEIYEAMRETVAIKDGDRFMALTEHDRSSFAYGDFLDVKRSEDLVQIQIFWAPGKATDAKMAMYRSIVDRLGRNPGVRPEDVLISVVESSAQTWSFGDGQAQFHKPDDRVNVQAARGGGTPRDASRSGDASRSPDPNRSQDASRSVWCWRDGFALVRSAAVVRPVRCDRRGRGTGRVWRSSR